jgi:hypothetical protein
LFLVSKGLPCAKIYLSFSANSGPGIVNIIVL